MNEVFAASECTKEHYMEELVEVRVGTVKDGIQLLRLRLGVPKSSPDFADPLLCRGDLIQFPTQIGERGLLYCVEGIEGNPPTGAMIRLLGAESSPALVKEMHSWCSTTDRIPGAIHIY
jgi:hypothetical protein